MSAEERRQEAAVAELGRRELDALLVTDLVNVRYLTGFAGTNAIAVIGTGGRRLLTDARYALVARAAVRGAEVAIGARDLLADAAAALRELAPGGRVGVEAESISLARYERVVDALEGLATVPTHGLVEDLRVRKDAGEIARVRRAAEIADCALARVLEQGLRGRREREVAFALHGALRAEGAEDPSFPIIVAAGPRGAFPHAVPADEPIPGDTLVVMDLGAIWEGYCSDLTRTIATGPLDAELARAYEVCLRAQEAAVAAAAPGVATGALDAVARDIIAAEGLGRAFGHGLGHGVGLAIHERPSLRPAAEGALEPGMIVTVEPGIYLEGRGGVRIEDLILITDDGSEVLSRTPKELMYAREGA